MLDKDLLSKNYLANHISNDNNFSPLMGVEKVDININWDILFGCSERCDGCYVNKFDDSTLTSQENSVNYLWEKVMNYDIQPNEYFSELVLGPTDITNNLNIESLLTNKKFIDIVNKFHYIVVTGSFLTTKEDMVKFIEWKNRLFPNHEVEFVIAFNINDLLANKAEYINKIKENLKLVHSTISGVFEHSFTMNMKRYDISESDYFQAKDILREEFGSIFELNPSFFRTHRKEHIKSTLDYFNTFFDSFENKDDIMLAHRNLHHAEFSLHNILVKGEQMYRMPFLYENSVLLDSALEMTDTFKHKHNTNKIQLDYLKEHNVHECLNCELLFNCMNRNIINIMRHYEFTECIVPKSCIIGVGENNGCIDKPSVQV